MRVAIVVRDFPVPSQTFVLSQVAGLVERGHHVEVVAECCHGQTVPDATCTGRSPQRTGFGELVHLAGLAVRLGPRQWPPVLRAAPTVTLGGRFRTARAAAWAARIRSSAARADVVHAHFGHDGSFAARVLAEQEPRVPLVVTYHGYAANQLARADPTVLADGFRTAEALTVGTAFMAGRLTDLGADADRIHVIPQGVDPVYASETAGHHRAGVLAAGRLVDCKGFDVAIEAIAHLQAAGRPIGLTIAGDGPERSALLALASSRGVAHLVDFVGWQAPRDLAALMRSAAIVVVPSVRSPGGAEEAQGLVAVEAMTAHAAVVVSDVGGLVEMVDNCRTGLIVPEHDPVALGDAIRRLCDDDDLRTRLADAGRGDAVQRFSRRAQIDSLVTLYEQLTATR